MSEPNAYTIWLTGEELEALERKIDDRPKEEDDDEHLKMVLEKLERSRGYSIYSKNA